MFEVYKSLRFFSILDHYLGLLPITDENIEIFKYNKSLSKQYQFTPVYQKLSYLHFFAGQLLLVRNRIVFSVNFVSFFDLVCPEASAKISQGKKNVRISNTKFKYESLQGLQHLLQHGLNNLKSETLVNLHASKRLTNYYFKNSINRYFINCIFATQSNKRNAKYDFSRHNKADMWQQASVKLKYT